MAKLIILFFAFACATVISAEFKDSKNAPNQQQGMIEKFRPRPPHSAEETEGAARAEHKAGKPQGPPQRPSNSSESDEHRPRPPHKPSNSSENDDSSESDEHRPRPPHRPSNSSESDEHRPSPPHRPPHHPHPKPTPTTTSAPEEPETTSADIEETTVQ